MTKFPLFVFFGSFMILSIFIFPMGLFTPVFVTDSPKIKESHINSSIDDNIPVVSEELRAQVEATLKGFLGGFVKNMGQKNAAVHYYTQSAGMAVGFGASEVRFNIVHQSSEQQRGSGISSEEPSATYTPLTLTFLGSNDVVPIAEAPTGVYCHYFRGSDSSNWATSNQYYARIIYPNLYEQINLIYTLENGQLKYEFYVYPGGNPEAIQLHWTGPVTLELLERGVQVTVHRTSHCTGDSAFTFIDASPILYQSLTRDETISGSFHLFESNMYGFSVPTYDPTRLLIIDPLILPLANPTYSTYIGGRYHDYGQEITVDAAENTYITGYTESTDFPTVNAYDGTFSGGAYDVFVCKLAANGSTLLYSTYIGGSNEDFGQGITIDTAGNAYVTGHTQSTNFPTVNAYDAIGDGSNGFTDVFVCKLAANGSTLLYSTYIGGSNDDQGRGIAVDDLDNAYITGYTWSTDFPTVNAYNDTFSGGANDMFVCKLAANGSTLLYSTYIGGSNDDQAHGIVVNDLGNAYVTGRTLSTDFPTVNAYDATSDGSTYTQDVFVLKLAANGSTLLYSTYISGSDSDNSVRIAIDEAENTYITGYTWSTDFPTTPNAYDPTGDGSTTFENIFICKLAANGSTMLYSTYISGEYIDRAYAIAIDTAGNAYVTGYTGSNDFPTTANAYNSTLGNAWDVFILKLSSDGTKLLYSTYVGGNGYDYGYGIAVDDLDNAYITGYTNSPNFPTKNAYNSSSNGSLDVFVLKLAANGTMQYSTYMSGSQDDQGWGIAVDAAGNVYVTGRTLSNDFPTMNPLFGDTDGDGSTAVWDAFIFKLATNGSTLLYSTYISSPNTDYANAIAVDTAGNAYVTGYTDSPSFPMENAYDNTHNGGWDVFVLKLAPTGDDLVYSTYVGGSNDDQGWAIAVDTAGNAYVTGETWSSDFPITPNAYNDTYSGSWRDVFVCKLTASGMLLNSTYVGGKTEEIGTGITVDTAGNAYVTGYTSSTNFPTTPNAYDDTGDGIFNHWDVFVFKLAANGSILLYSTYVSGTDDDIGREITIDDAGNAYVIGDTQSTDFPTWYSYDPTGDQDTDIWDAVVFKLAANGSILLYSTYISGSADEAGRGITVDAAGNAYITGWTYSTNFPTTLNAFDTIVNGQDVFVCKLTANGSTLLYSTYVGGSDSEGGFGIATDTAGNAYITGTTRSTDFPTVNAYDDTGDGSTSYWDGFVFKLVFDETAPSISLTSPTNNSAVQPGTTIDLTITDDNTGVWYVRYNWDGTTNTSLTAPYDLTVPASEGQHVLKVFTEDKFNNLAIATFVFTTDATAPTITLTSPSNESIRPSGTIVDLTIVDLNGVDQVKYNWDGSANASLTSPYDVTLPGPDGQYVLYVYANDSAGNWANQTYVFTTDDTDPVITLTSPANETIHINGTTIDLSISDLHLISVKYKWDAGSWTDFFTPYDTTLPEGDGTHTLYVNATDAAGHWVVHVYVFTTDDTDPIILLTSPTNETVHHSGTTIDLSISDLHLISVKYKWDGGGWNNFSILYETTLPTGAGTHTLYVNATDEAGNWVMHMYVFTTDDIDPVITLTSPTNETIWHSGTTIDLSISDIHLDTVKYKWDGNGWTDFFAPYDTLLPTGAGIHTLYVNATDEAGNWIVRVYVFTTDDTDPVITLTSPTNETVHHSGTTIDLSISDIHLDTVRYKWDGGSWTDFFAPYNTLLPVGDGDHTLYVNATDEAGNWIVRVYMFTTDDIDPVITLTSPTNETVHHSGTTIDLSISDLHLIAVKYRWDGSGWTDFFIPYDTLLPTGAGTHTLYVNATDAAGNWIMHVYVFTTDDIDPVITLTSPANETVWHSGTTIDLSISDIHLDTVRYKWDGSGWALFLTSYDTLLPVGDRDHTLYVNATDEAGNWVMHVYVFTTDDTNPIITLNSPANETTNPSGTTIDLSIADVHLDTVEYKWDAGSWTTFPVPYDTTLPAGDGTHTLYVNVTDEAGNWVMQVYVFTTDDTNPIITLNSPANETVFSSGTTIDLSITDTDLDTVQYKWDGDSWATFPVPYDTTLPGGDGTHMLYVNATDLSGHWTLNVYVFTTDDTDPVINLTSPANETIYPSGTTIDLSISDTNLDTVRYKWDAGSWTTFPAPYDTTLPAGDSTHTLYVNATDEAGHWILRVYVFTTDDIDPVISLMSPTNETIYPSGITIDLSISDTNLDTVEYKWDGGSWTIFPDPYDTTLPAGDGMHTLYINATDEAGNWVMQVYVFTTDDTDPVITLTSPTNETVQLSGTTIDLSISDTNLDTVEYKWDSGSWISFPDPYDTTLPAGDGTHTLYVNATDAAGNWVVHVFLFTTDGTDPVITLTSPASETVHQSGTTIDLSITDVNGITQVLYSWDGQSNSTLNSPYDVTLPGGEGTHTLHIYARDPAGNWVSATFMFTTDDTGPTIGLVSPEEGSISPAGTQILLKLNDTHMIAQAVYNWDGNANTTISPPYDAITDILLPATPGAHVLRIYVQDQIGNWASVTYVFTTETPTTSTSTPPTTPPTSTTQPTAQGDFFTVEVFLLALVALSIVLWYRKKRKPEA